MESNAPNMAIVSYQFFRTISFFIASLDSRLLATQEFVNSISIDVNGRDELRPNDKAVKILLEVNFKTNLDGIENPFIQFVSESTFYVENFNEVYIKSENDDLYTIPEVFNNHMLGIAYGTVRGVLIEKLATSQFRLYIIPILPPNMLRINRDFHRVTGT